MNWKSVLAIVAAAGLALVAGVWVGNCKGSDRFIQRDAEREVEVMILRKAQEEDRARAATMTEELQARDKTIDGLRGDVAASKGQIDALRRKVRTRPVQAGCEDCEELVTRLDLTVADLDDLVFEQDTALQVCKRRDAVRLDELEKCRQVDELQTERLSDWKKQTKRGRVKAAFLAIGVGLGAGAAGYGIGRATP